MSSFSISLFNVFIYFKLVAVIPRYLVKSVMALQIQKSGLRVDKMKRSTGAKRQG